MIIYNSFKQSEKLVEKLKYIIGFNIIMFCSYLILYAWWIFEHYIKDKRYFLWTGDFWFLIVLTILFCIVIYAIKKK